MSMRSLYRYLAICAVILIIGMPAVHAQTDPSGTIGLQLTSSTESPIPGQTLTITAESYNIDIDSAALTWISNGKVIAKGIGVTTATVQAPALGKNVAIEVTATAADGTSFTNSIILGSGSVDLIVEPDGYVPPFFMGKNAVAYQNAVKIVAMPHLANSSGVEYDPSTLVYQWQQDGAALADQSGYDKQSIVIPGNIVPHPYTISVTVSTRDGSAQGTEYIPISPISPEVLFYNDDPLYGALYNRALGNSVYVGSQRELGVRAVPYGFDVPAIGLGNLSLTWLIDGVEHQELETGESVTLRAPAGTAGSSDIELDINNTQNILQQASATFSAIFSAGSTADTQSNVTF